MKKPNGFTLVELAIVLMIIGLLIGGILKGQELIQNARINAFIRQNRSFDAAIITFLDSYGALPGDIASPSTRLANCSATPCSNAGNANGVIGPNSSFNNENNTAFVHLGAANLLANIDPAGWAADSAATMLSTPLGGSVFIINYANVANAYFVNGVYGHHYLYRASGSVPVMLIPVNTIAKIDQKMDDGKPWSGDVLVSVTVCGIASGATEYNASNTTACSLWIKAGFAS